MASLGCSGRFPGDKRTGARLSESNLALGVRNARCNEKRQQKDIAFGTKPNEISTNGCLGRSALQHGGNSAVSFVPAASVCGFESCPGHAALRNFIRIPGRRRVSLVGGAGPWGKSVLASTSKMRQAPTHLCCARARLADMCTTSVHDLGARPRCARAVCVSRSTGCGLHFPSKWR